MRNVHTFKGIKAVGAFTQCIYDLENLEPAVGEILISGSATQREIILAQVSNLHYVLYKCLIHIRNENKRGSRHGR